MQIAVAGMKDVGDLEAIARADLADLGERLRQPAERDRRRPCSNNPRCWPMAPNAALRPFQILALSSALWLMRITEGA